MRDEGIGLEPQYSDYVFEAFKRLNPNTPGSGIGLALCKAIIDDHGGRIWVESEPGNGAAFYFTLPKTLRAKTPRAKSCCRPNRKAPPRVIAASR